MDGYQFDDVGDTSTPPPAPAFTPAPAHQGHGSSHGSGQGSLHGGQAGGQGRSYAEEIYTKQIHAKFRTFFVDLKQSSNGKFLKISEKSHGRKNTIMIDAEDVPQVIEAMLEAQKML